jgi:predicted amidohydrolase
MEETLKIGVAQIPNSLELEKNFDTICRFLNRFKSANVDLVVFPECGLSGFSAKMKECTSDFLAKYLDQVQKWSNSCGIEVILPTAVVENQKIYNSGFWFKKAGKIQFYKLGLTDSEKEFFSLPEEKSQKVFEIGNFKCALLICKEAQDEPWLSMNPGEADVIIWPGYWGWTTDFQWQEFTNSKKNLVFANASLWQRPLVQANFAFNDLAGSSVEGPEGLSIVVNSDNTVHYQAAHKKECGFIVSLQKQHGKTSVTACRELV